VKRRHDPRKLNKTKKRFITILNANLEENSIILTPGEIIVQGLMCSVGNLIKQLLMQSNQMEIAKWSHDKLDDNEILYNNLNISKLLYSVLNSSTKQWQGY